MGAICPLFLYMKFSARINEELFQVYAIRAYRNPVCLSEEEYKQDIKRITTIKRLMSRYINGESVNLRILLNAFVTFFNVFDHKCACIMLFHKADVPHFPYIKTILLFLNLMPKSIWPEFEKIPTVDTFYQQLEEVTK